MKESPNRQRAIGRALAPHIAALSCILLGAVHADDWPQWRGPNRDGTSAETNWFVNWPPVMVWTQHVGEGFSGASISEGRLYTMGWEDHTNTVYCLDAEVGTQVWSYSYGCLPGRDSAGPRATPTVSGELLYTVSQTGHLHCINTDTGGVVWERMITNTIPWGYSASPVVEDDLLILSYGRRGYALDRHSGTNVWTSSTSYLYINGYASPFVFTWNAKRLVALTTYYGLDFVNAETGAAESWYDGFGPRSLSMASDPVVFGDRVFVNYVNQHTPEYADHGRFCGVYQLADGEMTMVWTNSTSMICECNTPVFVDDHLYGCDRDEGLRCVTASNGVVQWSWNPFDFYEGGLILVDGKLIVLGFFGDLGILNPTPVGRQMLRDFVKVIPDAANEEWYAPPSLANGMIYCRSHSGLLVCLRLGPPPADRDRDGMADSWEDDSLGGTNAPTGGPMENRDGDPAPNKNEYVCGTGVTDSNSYLSVSLAFSNDRVVVTWPTAAADGVGYEGLTRYYSLETTTDLVHGAWQAVPGKTDIPGVDGEDSYVDAGADGAREYRVRVRLE